MDTSNQRLRVGICGLGFMGRTYFRHLREHPLARVVAVCDRLPALRAGHWDSPTGNIPTQMPLHPNLTGVAAYAGPAELIHDANVDVVAITLPTPLHAEVAEQALLAGKHVICEKPMARDLSGCDRMIAAARSSGRTLMVAQCIRFWPQYELIQQLVSQGRIGPLRFVKLSRLASPPVYSSENWLMNGAASGGALLDLHVHDVDFTQSWLGVPATIYARGGRGPSGEIDHVLSIYSYDDGRYALLEASWVHHAPWPFEMAITVCGEKGTLHWSSLAGDDVLLYAGGQEALRLPAGGTTGWQRELDYFLACIASGQPVRRCPPESSRISIALSLLERQSIEGRRPVTVPAELRACAGAHPVF